MISLDKMEKMLNEIVDEFPNMITKELNGGIILLPEPKLNKKAEDNSLYIMGQYHHGGVMGRYITIYYGSFVKLYGHLTDEQMKQRLKSTIKHEFIHHLESLAGEKGLQIEDEKFIRNYLKQKKASDMEKYYE